MKAPDFDAKCHRCGTLVRWDGGDCCRGSMPMAHSKQDGTPCLPPEFRTPTSITMPAVKGGWPVLDIKALMSVQPMTGPLAPIMKYKVETKKSATRRKSK